KLIPQLLEPNAGAVYSRAYGLTGADRRSGGDRLKLLDPLRLRRVHRMPEIPVLLQAEPEVGRHAQHSSQSQRGVGRDATLPVNHLVQARIGHANPLGEIRLAHTQRLEKLLQQHLAGMRRRTVSRQLTHTSLGARWPTSRGLPRRA